MSPPYVFLPQVWAGIAIFVSRKDTTGIVFALLALATAWAQVDTVLRRLPLRERRLNTTLRMAGRAAQSLLAMTLGYALFVIGTIVARLPFDELSYTQSSLTTLVAGAFLVPLAGVLGGFVTAALAPARPFWHIAPGCILIVVESTWLFVTHRSDGPLWFETGAALSLIVGYVVGAAAWVQLQRWRGSRDLIAQ